MYIAASPQNNDEKKHSLCFSNTITKDSDDTLPFPDNSKCFFKFVCLLFICLSRLKFWMCSADVDLLYPSTHIHTQDSHYNRNFIPPLLECVGSLTFHRELLNTEDMCETGPTISSPYPRRLESLTICA